MKTSALLLLVSLVASPAMFAGEFGLSVDPSFPHPCKREASRSLNYCTTAAVVQDLRGHFISGRRFGIKAVEMAVLSASISLSADALATFNEGIVAICLSESPHDFDAFKRFLYYLPYSSLRVRLVSELPVAQRPAIRARLREALSALPRSVADAAIRAYKPELFEAGDRDQCHEALKRVGRAMTIDARISDVDIQAEIDLYEKVKGPMPYPSPGTACELFGFQEAAHAALEERRKKRAR
jgi:hypothetical protein